MAHPLTSMPWWRRALVIAAALLVTAPVGATAAQGTSPTTDSFITRSGSQLLVDGSPFRFGGANIYWLGLDENVGGVDYPTYFRIDDALRTAKAMGATVVRSHTLGISTGAPLTFEPTLGTFNQKAFATIDYAVAAARRLGIRLVIPLVDNWAYYHGGRRDFTNWFGLPAEAFYTDSRVIAAYQDYIAHLLAHVNPYTGRAFGAEPTVLAWELGNELDGMTPQWVDTISGYLKQLSPRTLVAAPGVSTATLTGTDVDIVDAHYYPPSATRILSDAARVTDAGKVYLGGEYGSISATAEMMTAVAADPRVTGLLFWSLFGHDDHHGFVPHGDGFTVHYPGDTPAMRRSVQAIEQFARAVDPGVVAPALGAPLLTSTAHTFGETMLTWRGTAGAVGYTVQRSTTGASGPWTAVSALVTDNDTPWIDQQSLPTTAWYRVVAQDAAGRQHASAPQRVAPDTGTLVDPLSSWASTTAHTDNLVVRPEGDRVSVAPDGTGPAQITWSRPGLTGFAVEVTAPARAAAPAVLVSADGTRWRHTAPRRTARGTGRYTLTLDHLHGVNQVRVAWPHIARSGVARVTGVASRYAEPVVDTSPPAAFGLLTPADGATGAPLVPTLAWSPAARAGHYTLVVSARADLSAPVIDVTGLRDTTYTSTEKLQPRTTYYWSVTAANLTGSTTATPTRGTFTTVDPTAVPLPVEDFGGYAGDDALLQAAYVRNTGGDPLTVTLDGTYADVAPSMAVNYTLGTAGYAGVTRTFTTPQDWSADVGLSLWLLPDPAGRPLTVQFQAAGIFWETTVTPAGTGARVERLPFSSFGIPPWATPGPLDLTQVGQLSFYVGGTPGAGTLYLDSVAAYPAG